MLGPIKAESLKDVFVARFEQLILSGKIGIGERLPSERELAIRMGVSRPVVHDGLVELAARGLVSMKPRVGSVVNDYRREGSLAILASLMSYNNGLLDPKLLDSMLETRRIIEVETARMAAQRRGPDHLEALDGILREEAALVGDDPEPISEVDFRFHHLVAMATDNVIYPLILNSFKQVYTNFTRLFFSDTSVVAEVFGYHRELAEAIRGRDVARSVDVMRRLLAHGAGQLKERIAEESLG